MKLRSLLLESYGHFSSLELELGEGLNLIQGPNEAGKTTILSALRDLWFGMHRQTPYNFRFGYQAMRVTGTAALADGGTWNLARRKGHKGTLEIAADPAPERALDEGDLETLLGLDRALYEAVFGFTHADLAQGAALLETAEIDRILTGSVFGAGGDRLQAVLDSLSEEQESLYKSRGQKQVINELLRRIDELEKQRNQETLTASALRDLRREAVNLENRINDLQDDINGLVRQRARQDRLLEALPLYQQAVRIDAGFETAPPVLRQDQVNTLAGLLTHLAELGENIVSKEAELSDVSDQLRHINVDPLLLEHGIAIQALYRQLDQVKNLRESIPEAERKLRIDDAELERRRKEIGVPADLRSWTVTDARRSKLSELSAAWTLRTEDLRKTSDELENRRQDLAQAEAKLKALEQAAPAPELGALLARQEELKTQHQELRRLKAETTEPRRAWQNRFEAQVPTPPEDFNGLPRLETVQARVQELERLQEARRDTARDLETLKQELAEKSAEQGALLDGAGAVSAEALRQAREERGRAWTSVQKAWSAGRPPGEPDPDLDSSTGLAELFSNRLETTDRLSDQRFDRAEAAARLTTLDLDLARLESRKASLEELLDVRDNALDEWTETWKNLWPGDSPDPAAAEGWLSDITALRDEQGTLQLKEEQLKALSDSLDPVLGQLADLLEDPDDAMAALASRQRLEVERQADLRSSRSVAEDAAALIDVLTPRLGQHEEALADLQTRTDAMAAELGLPDGEDPVTFQQRIIRLDELARDAVRIEEERTALEGDKEQLADFDRTGRELLALLGRKEVEGHELDVTVEALHGEQIQAGQQAAVRDRLDEEKETLEATLARLQEEQGAANNELEEMASRLNFPAALARQLLERSGLHLELDRLCGEGWASEEFADRGPEDLQAEVERLQAEAAGLISEKETLRDELAIKRRHLEELGGAAAATLEAEIAGLETELNEAWRQYALLRLAGDLLKRTMEKYTREHQPALLKRTGEIFVRLTRGAYTDVRLESDDELLVFDADAVSKKPSQLSTGTNEQLFLALRLAYIQERNRRREPLPVIMDDVLVQFDDARAEAAIEALADMAKDTQIIMFSCHDRTADMARRVLDKPTILELKE